MRRLACSQSAGFIENKNRRGRLDSCAKPKDRVTMLELKQCNFRYK